MSARLTRAFMSDHRLNRAKAQQKESDYFALIVALIVLGAILKVTGVVG